MPYSFLQPTWPNAFGHTLLYIHTSSQGCTLVNDPGTKFSRGWGFNFCPGRGRDFQTYL